jgi:hypothetical protein
LNTIFNINSNFNAFEAYTEFWAEFINIIFISFIFNKKQKNFTEFWQIASVILFYEIQFSLLQCVKVLNFMNLNYTDLFTHMGKQLYKEKTNVFSYHVLKTILLFNIDDFLLWCKQYNNSLLQFNSKKYVFKSFFEFIKGHHLNAEFINQLHITEDYLKLINKSSNQSEISREIIKTLRMSIVDI